MVRWRLEQLPPPVRDVFRRYDRRKRLLAVMGVLLLMIAVYALAAWLAMHVDRFYLPDTGQRWAMTLGIHGILAVATLGLLAWIALRPMHVRRVAYSIEAKLGQALQERYSTLADHLNEGTDRLSPDQQTLLAELEKATLRVADPRGAARLARNRWLSWLSLLLIAVLVFVAIPLLMPTYQYPLMIQRFLMPHRDLERPSFVQMELSSTGQVIGQGRPFVLQVRTEGTVPALWQWILARLQVDLPATPVIDLYSDAEAVHPIRRNLTMIRDGLYLFSEARVERDFLFQVHTGDARSERMAVEAVAIPGITGIWLEVTPPAYTNLEPRVYEYTGQGISLLPDSQVTLTFTASQPVVERQIHSDLTQQPIVPQWDAGDLKGTHRFTFRSPVNMTVRLRNERGFENTQSPLIAITVLEDQPASVRIQAQQVVSETSATDPLSIPFIAEDDYGVMEAAVTVVVNPLGDERDVAREQRLERRYETREVEDIALLDLSRFDVNPGDRILVRMRVRDSAGQSSFSQAVLIDITAFGRETREEARIRVMRFLEPTFEQVGQSMVRGDAMVGIAGNIGDGVYQRILERAEQQGIVLARESRFVSLLQLIEREHFLTENPWDKEDLRRIHGILSLAGAALAGGQNPIDRRNDILYDMIDDVLMPLADYRELKNLSWRLLGLRDAMASQPADLSRDAREARVKLILDTLDACLVRLSTIARRNREIDATGLNQAVSRINTIKARLLGQSRQQAVVIDDDPFAFEDDLPSQPRPMSADAIRRTYADLQAPINSLLALARDALPPVLQRREVVRTRLQSRFDEMLATMAALAMAEDGGPRWHGAMDFLETDMRLARNNPLFFAEALFTNHRLSERLLAYAPGGPRPAPPPGGLTADLLAPSQIQSLGTWMQAVDQFFTYGRILGLKRLANITEAERNIAAAIDALEMATRSDDAQLTARLTADLGAVDPARDPSKPLWMLADPMALCTHVRDYPAMEAALGQIIMGLSSPPDLKEQAERVLAAFQATNDALGIARQAMDPLDIERHVLRLFVDRVQFRINALHPEAGSPEAFAAFFLNLRELRDRPPATLVLLTDGPGEGRLLRRQLQDIDLDPALIRQHRQAVFKRLQTMVQAWHAGQPQDLKEYQQVLLEQILASDDYMQVSAQISRDAGQAEVARRYIHQSAQATGIYLASSMARLHEILGAMDQVRATVVQSRQFDADRKQALTRQTASLLRYRQDLVVMHDSPFKAHLLSELDRVLTGLQALGDGQHDVNVVIHQSGVLLERLRDLGREISAFAVGVETLRFTGGSMELQDMPVTRVYEAERMLLDNFRNERNAMSLSIFAALDDDAEGELPRMALPHGAMVYRMLRSDLVRYRPFVPLVPTGTGTGDYIEFLNEEVSRALQVIIGQYPHNAKMHLGRMGGFPWEVPDEYKD